MKKCYLIFYLILLQTTFALSFEKKGDIVLYFDTGVSFSNNMKHTYEKNMGKSILLGFGAKFSVMPKIKIGANLSHRPDYEFFNLNASNNITESQKFNITSFMLDASYDITKIKDWIVPYVGVGIGASRIRLGSYIVKEGHSKRLFPDTDKHFVTNLSWGGTLGVTFKINKNFNISLGYKYTDFGKINKTIVASDVTDTAERQKGKITTNDILFSFGFVI